MAKSKFHDKMVEAICDYKKGWSNLSTASKELQELTGLTRKTASSLLKTMKRNNIIKIRDYINQTNSSDLATDL